MYTFCRASIALSILFLACCFIDPARGVEATPTTETIQAPDEAGSVRIYRDEWGVPHIYAQREQDGFFGLGYAQGEDGLEKLLMVYVTVTGRSAAAFGAAGKPADLRAAQWRHLEAAREGFKRLSPQLRRNYTSYTDGLRHYMKTHPERTPAWVGELEPWEWVAWSRAIFWDYKTQDGLRDCAVAGVKPTAHNRDLLQRSQQGLMASNAWYLSPSRSADGRAMILSDPHAEIDGFLFYEFSMHAGNFNVAGYTIGPLMLLMHNQDVAWGMTTGAPDVSDCYEIQVERDAPRQYRYDGTLRNMVVKPATFQVKDGAPITAEFEYAQVNGALAPVIGRKGDKAYVVSTSYMNAAGIFDEEVYRMNRARNIAEIRAAHELNAMFPQNVISADRFGDSYYLRAGRTPRRAEGYDSTKPMPGNTSATAWKGLHPASELVHIANPATGFMQNNNTPPYLMMGNDKVGPQAEDYLDYIYYDVPMFRYVMRAYRTNEVLERAYAFTVEDAKALAVDDKWFATERWQLALGRALERERESILKAPSETRAFAQRLMDFDGHGHASSKAALAYFHWRDALVKSLSAEQASAINTSLVSGQPPSEDIQKALVAAIATAANDMKKAYGTTEVLYGDVFRIGRTAERSWPVSGSTPLDIRRHSECKLTEQNALPCPLTQRAYIAGAPDEKGRRLITAGSRAMRLIVLGEPMQSFSMHNYGQSSDPQSPHFDDQARELVSKGQLKPTYFTPQSLQGHVQSSITLSTRQRH